MNRRKLCWVAVAGACWAAQAGAEPPAGDRVAAYGRVSPEAGVVTVAVPYFQGTPQVLQALFVREGDQVSRGQQLAVTQGAALAAAELEAAKAHQATAEDRVRALGAKAKSEDLAVAQAEVAEAQAGVARAEALAGFTVVKAPSDGQVLKILAQPGESGTDHGLLEMADTRAMVIKTELSVADAARVKPGARATIHSEAWPGELAGTVARISPRVDRSQLAALSTYANVDRQIVEATVVPETPDKLGGRTGAEATVLISAEPAAK